MVQALENKIPEVSMRYPGTL